jgi:hypothetical protein
MEDRERIVEVEREPVVERHTTVVSTGGERSGGGGTLLAVLVLIVALVVLFLMFGRGLIGGASDATDVKVNIETPDLPDVTPPSK